MDQGGLNLIWVLSKRTAGGIKAIFRPIYLSFRCKIWMGNVSALFALRRKKQNDVFILCCVCLCGKRGGNSHVALRYLFTLNTQPPNSSTETHNSAAGSPHATTTHNPNLSHPNLFRRNLRFTQIRLICPITTAPLGANYQIDHFSPYFLRSLPLLNLFRILEKNLGILEEECETLFLLELTSKEKEVVLQSL